MLHNSHLCLCTSVLPMTITPPQHVQTVHGVTPDTDHAEDRCVYSEDTPTSTQHLLQTVMTSAMLSRCHAVTLSRCLVPPCGCVTHLDHVGVSSVRCRLLQAGDIGLWPPLPRPPPGPGAGERRHQTLHPGKLEYPRRLLEADVILCCQTK